MNLTQIVWYSLAIGFSLLFVVIVLSYLISKFKREEKPANYINNSVVSSPERNLTNRSQPPKIVYVKKHSELKEKRLETKEVLRKKKNIINQKQLSGGVSKAQQLLNGERFTIVNDRMRFAEESYYYVPDYQRRGFNKIIY